MNIKPASLNLQSMALTIVSPDTTAQRTSAARTAVPAPMSAAQAETSQLPASLTPQTQPDQESPVYRRPVVSRKNASESNEETFARTQAAAKQQTKALKSLHNIKMAFGEFMQQLATKHPELANNKSWGFSVAADGSLAVNRAQGQRLDLTEPQQLQLTALLNSNEELVTLASNFSSTMLEGLELQRGPEKKGHYRSEYDLTAENFAKVINFKKIVETLSEFASEQTWFARQHGLPNADDYTAMMAEFDGQLMNNAKRRYYSDEATAG